MPLAAAVIIHLSDTGAVPAVIGNESGCPESIRDMSGSGPLAPIFKGVWQSLQPPTVTRYLPRSTRAWVAAADAPPVHAAVPRVATNAPAATLPQTMFLVMMVLRQPSRDGSK